MIVHLIDGTYELFRHFYGQRRFNKGKDKPYGAVAGVLHTVVDARSRGGSPLLGARPTLVRIRQFPVSSPSDRLLIDDKAVQRIVREPDQAAQFLGRHLTSILSTDGAADSRLPAGSAAPVAAGAEVTYLRGAPRWCGPSHSTAMRRPCCTIAFWFSP